MNPAISQLVDRYSRGVGATKVASAPTRAALDPLKLADALEGIAIHAAGGAASPGGQAVRAFMKEAEDAVADVANVAKAPGPAITAVQDGPPVKQVEGKKGVLPKAGEVSSVATSKGSPGEAIKGEKVGGSLFDLAAKVAGESPAVADVNAPAPAAMNRAPAVVRRAIENPPSVSGPQAGSIALDRARKLFENGESTPSTASFEANGKAASDEEVSPAVARAWQLAESWAQEGAGEELSAVGRATYLADAWAKEAASEGKSNDDDDAPDNSLGWLDRQTAAYRASRAGSKGVKQLIAPADLANARAVGGTLGGLAGTAAGLGVGSLVGRPVTGAVVGNIGGSLLGANSANKDHLAERGIKSKWLGLDHEMTRGSVRRFHENKDSHSGS